MIPIWAKDRTGKWQAFPTHLVETLSDGSLGFKLDLATDNYERRKYFAQFRQHFELYPIPISEVAFKRKVGRRLDYRLVKQPTNE